MTERILVNQFAGSSLFDATLGVYIAPGADLSVSPTLWTFYDVTDKVMWKDLVTIGFGRADEQSQAQPATCDFTLLNDAGDFTPRRPAGRYFPNMRLGFPVKVVFYSTSTGTKEQFTGYVDEIAPEWDISLKVPTVRISAKGPIQRIQQGDAPRAATINRAALDLTYRANVANYWPMDEQADDTPTKVFGSGIGASPLNITGANGMNFATFDGIPGSNPLPTFNSGTNINGPFDGPASTTGAVYFRCLLNAATTLTDLTNMIKLTMTGGTVDAMRLLYTTGGGLRLSATSPSGAELDTTGAVSFAIDSRTFYLSLEFVQSGADINTLIGTWKLNADGTASFNSWTDTFTGLTLGSCTRFDMGGNGTMTDWAVGHVGVANSQSWLFLSSSLLTGYNSELAHNRVTRLASYYSIPMTVSGATATYMGTEGTSTLMDGLRECEFANDGVLYDGVNFGMAFRAREAKQNRAVDLPLDIRRGHIMPPFSAVENTQKTRNTVTVSRLGGASSSYAQPSGQPYAPASVGTYEDSVTVNIDRDVDLPGQAHWRVHMGTIDLDRCPSLALDFTAAPSLAALWLASPGIGARITVTGLPVQAGYDPDLFVEGYTMTIGPKDWRLDLNCSPAAPYDVVKVNSDLRVATRGAVLTNAVTTGATSLTVDSNPPGRFSTSAGTFDLAVGGYKVSCTAISGAGTTQTFTVSSMPGPVAAGAIVQVWYPATVSLEG